ncbi:ligase-associated DNA damage response DEXH box helicase [Futiania mangrovi]|uniref:Ligase-associated DNA damage response DEXH box helicase n=1 Tax=Futiania mangrovi TaxID=2959716 RepID=A0A9J6P8T9_9PROT|nr:ligase-associated DNA damage response DEXH box helicase [Futiania mangrovii]MCP1336196.1 ligase-associated DNA damage response DEXH box helicase [Futiania mangrovii]
MAKATSRHSGDLEKEHLLPSAFADWFSGRGWTPRPHQLAMLEAARAGESVLLTAPTGGGKTLAGFLPSLVDLAGMAEGDASGARPWRLHTLYVSPLKALAVDIARNLEQPVAEMGLGLRIETRTGDTPQARRQRQRTRPPDILLTTPEQIALLLSYHDADRIFAGLKTVIVDELHAMEGGKRGDLLALGLARLRTLAPGLRAVGLSATVADPDRLARWLVPQPPGGEAQARRIVGAPGAKPEVAVLFSDARVPWSGHSARHAVGEVMTAIRAHRTTLVFVNTRSQAEVLFQELWRENEDALPIALHHGSLSVEQRRKVEAAMAKGALRAVVCTSTLDLGIDWGDVDLVIQIGAPKGSSRLLQRIGRANHRLDQPSRALLVPSNRFEYLECLAARVAVEEGALDGEPPAPGALDVLAQHVTGVACGPGVVPDRLHEEVRSASPYAHLDRQTFDRVLAFVETGGYALRRYDRFRRLKASPDGRLVIASRGAAQAYRMNVGTIVEAPMLKVRLTKPGRGASAMGGRMLGEIEEWFVEQLGPGDTFLFAGEVLRLEGLRETDVFVSRAGGAEPKVPSYQGGKFPLSTFLADRVRGLLADREGWGMLSPQVEEWLALQAAKSVIPARDQMLVETFPRGRKHYLVAYPFEGRLAHQTLGMLLTRRLERAGLRPMGFAANEYGLAVWGLRDMRRVGMDALFEEDMLGDDLDAWMAESALLKRTFRNCAVIAGLVERRFPGREKTGRQVTMSTDLIYDVLRQHEPDHVLLQATRADAARGLLDIGRLGALLARIRGRIVHRPLARISPLSVPIMLEVGREPIYGSADEDLLAEAADTLIAEAKG